MSTTPPLRVIRPVSGIFAILWIVSAVVTGIAIFVLPLFHEPSVDPLGAAILGLLTVVVVASLCSVALRQVACVHHDRLVVSNGGREMSVAREDIARLTFRGDQALLVVGRSEFMLDAAAFSERDRDFIIAWLRGAVR